MKKYNEKANVIGKLLTEHRLKKGLTKEEVCRRLELVELYRMETEVSIVKDFELIALCDVLDIDYNTEIRKLID